MCITNANSAIELKKNPIIIQFGKFRGNIEINDTKNKFNIKI